MSGITEPVRSRPVTEQLERARAHPEGANAEVKRNADQRQSTQRAWLKTSTLSPSGSKTKNA
jgi:hypothetical protein